MIKQNKEQKNEDQKKENLMWKPWQIILLISFLLLFIFFSLKEIISWLSNLKSKEDITLIVIVLSAFLSVLSVVIGKHLEIKHMILQQNREKKENLYEDFISSLFGFFLKAKEGEKVSESMISSFKEKIPSLIIWAHEDVIKSYKTLFQTVLNLPQNLDPKKRRIEKNFNSL